MRYLVVIISCLIFMSSSFAGEETVTELLDEAQNSIKMAFEANSDKKSPYEYAKAVTFYEIAKEETSKLNIKAGKAAALKSIEWALKAISNAYMGGER